MFRKTFTLYRNSFSGLPREIWLISMVSLINRSGAMVIPFLTVYLTRKMGFSLIEAGWVMSAFGLGSIAGSFVGGRLTDRFGHYPVQFWSLLLGGGMYFVLMQMESLWAIAVTTFFTSMVNDTFRPANMASISAYSPKNLYTRSVALLRFAINLGFSIGPAVGGFLAATVGYKWLFVVDGLTCMIAAGVFRMFVSHREDEKTEEKTDQSAPAKIRFSVFSDRAFMTFAFFQLMVSVAFMQFFSTLPVFLKNDMKLSEDAIGALLAINGLIIVAMEMPLIYLIENRFSRLTLIRAGMIAMGLAYLSLWLGGLWVWIALVFIILITVGEMINFPFGNTYALERASSETRGKYMGMYAMIFSTSFVLAPSLGTWVAGNWGFHVLWLVLTGLCFVAATGIYFLGLREKKAIA
ncbi:MAG: MFS transporter [Bacteroidia bacterium]|nr:MFS transporter [Bacteroidia bacterium]